MDEKDWVLSFIERMQNSLRRNDETIRVEAAKKVIYAQEILRYNESNQDKRPSYKRWSGLFGQETGFDK